jgi:hypothetical protein
MNWNKITQLLFISIFGFSACKKEVFIITCLPSGLQDGVIAFYPFSNSSITDESLNNHDLNNPTDAKPVPDRNGNSDCAFEFVTLPGHAEFLTTDQTGFLDHLNSFSISVWFEPLDTSIHGSWLEVLVGRGEGLKCPDRKGEWSLGLYDGRRAVFGHNTSVWILSGHNPTHEWHHVVATKNNDTYKIYLDGILSNQANGNANCTSLHLAQDVGDLFIGKDFTGRLDDIVIYNRELTAEEVLELFELEPCCE